VSGSLNTNTKVELAQSRVRVQILLTPPRRLLLFITTTQHSGAVARSSAPRSSIAHSYILARLLCIAAPLRKRRRVAAVGPCAITSPLLFAATRSSRIGQPQPPFHGTAATSTSPIHGQSLRLKNVRCIIRS
jgi:hypothetical protein